MQLLPIVKMVGGTNRYPSSRRFVIVAYAMVDEKYFDYLNQFIWVMCHGYPVRSEGKGNPIYLHQEVAKLAGFSLSEVVDHIDRNLLNAQEKNLRPATCSEDELNKGLSKKSVTGFKGVIIYASNGKYRARLGKRHLGYFGTAIEAALAYDAAALLHFGSRATTNKSLGLL